MVKNMYDLVMPFSVRRSRLVLQSGVESRLGQVSLAGYIRHSTGIPLHRRGAATNRKFPMELR